MGLITLSGCATPKSGIFVGDDSDIEYVVPKAVEDEQKACQAAGKICVGYGEGISIGRLDTVEIDKIQDDKVQVVSHNGWHADTHAWIRRSAIAFESDFKPVGQWMGDSHLRLCEQNGCYYYEIAPSGSYSVQYQDDCSIINIYGKCTYHCPFTGAYDDQDCRDSGQVIAFKDIYRLQNKSGYFDYLLAVPGQGICWAIELELHHSCTGMEWWPQAAIASNKQIQAYAFPKIGAELLAASSADSAQAAGLQPLKEAVLQPKQKEIRIWQGFGLVDKLRMLRITINGYGEISADTYSMYSAAPDDLSQGDWHEYLGQVRMHCAALHRFADREACIQQPHARVDWQAIYKELEQDDIWGLPDSIALANYDVNVKDGMEMLVELRDGDSYRAYAYENPGYSKTNEGIKAAAILKIFARVYESYPQN